MKISFDIQTLLKGEKTGIGWAIQSIIEGLNLKAKNCYQLNYFSLGYSKENKNNITHFQDRGFILNPSKIFHDVPYRMIWNLLPIPYSTFFGKDSDVTVFFNYIIPPGVKGKKIAMIHDMSYKAYPETVRVKTRKYLEINLQKTCNRADKIFTISEFSKKEIVKYINIDKSKIEVIPLGVDTTLYNTNINNKKFEDIREKFNIKNRYLLYIGTIEPRKNLERLIQAYSLLNREFSEVPDFYIVGKKGWYYEDIFKAVQEEEIEDKVHFLGYLSQEEKILILKGAEVFLFPSIYEGFGLPVLEAMACGVPVVTSNTSSLPEVVNEAGLLVDPFDIESIKDGISILVNNEHKRKEYSERGVQQAKSFSWGKTCCQLSGLIERA